MDKAAAQLMGEPVLAGSLVASVGTTNRMAIGAGLGGVLGATLASSLTRGKEPATPGGHKGMMYVAVGSTKVAFFSAKQGLFGYSIKELLLEVPRDEVAQFDVGGGALTAAVTVALRDGANYRLEVHRSHRGKAQKVQRELAA